MLLDHIGPYQTLLDSCVKDGVARRETSWFSFSPSGVTVCFFSALRVVWQMREFSPPPRISLYFCSFWVRTFCHTSVTHLAKFVTHLSHIFHARNHTTFRTDGTLLGELLSHIRSTSIMQVAPPPHVKLEVWNLTNISSYIALGPEEWPLIPLCWIGFRNVDLAVRFRDIRFR